MIHGYYFRFPCDVESQIILVGDSGVGKSNLLSRFTHNIFNPEERATIGVDMMTRDACIHGQFGPVTVRLQVWIENVCSGVAKEGGFWYLEPTPPPPVQLNYGPG